MNQGEYLYLVRFHPVNNTIMTLNYLTQVQRLILRNRPTGEGERSNLLRAAGQSVHYLTRVYL